MSTPSYKALMTELMKFNELNPERFKRFWDSVYLKLYNLPEGGSFLITAHCKVASVELFKKIAMVFVLDHERRREKYDDYYEFSDDYNVIYHVRKFVPSVPLSSKFKTWSGNLLLCKDSEL